MGVSEELAGIGRVGATEDNGGSGHGGGGFSGKIRPGSARVNLVGGSVSSHVFGPLPTVMVRIPISNLYLGQNKNHDINR